MGRVTGIGGIFIKSRNPEALAEWYQKHLGISYKKGEGACLMWKDDPQTDGGMSIFSVFADKTEYFAPSTSPFMINFRVEDIDGLVAKLVADGANVDPKRDDYPYGRFAWVYDPDGNKIELWEPGK